MCVCVWVGGCVVITSSANHLRYILLTLQYYVLPFVAFIAKYSIAFLDPFSIFVLS